MKNKVRLKCIVTVEYDAFPENYGTDDPLEMASVDEENFLDDPNSLYEFLEYRMEDEDFTIKVEPV